jgi:putative membrane protein
VEPIDFLIAWLVTGSSLLLISQLPIGVEAGFIFVQAI